MGGRVVQRLELLSQSFNGLGSILISSGVSVEFECSPYDLVGLFHMLWPPPTSKVLLIVRPINLCKLSPVYRLEVEFGRMLIGMEVE